MCFSHSQRNALDPDMELKKRISIPMRQLDKYHTAKSTLDIDLSEWKFTDNGDPSQVEDQPLLSIDFTRLCCYMHNW